MEMITIDLDGVELDVVYSCTKTQDGYGTGDSPTFYEIDIQQATPTDSATDIWPLIEDKYSSAVWNAIIQEEES
jgi:hypothetical protein